jgi:hypothetical protein
MRCCHGLSAPRTSCPEGSGLCRLLLRVRRTLGTELPRRDHRANLRPPHHRPFPVDLIARLVAIPLRHLCSSCSCRAAPSGSFRTIAARLDLYGTTGAVLTGDGASKNPEGSRARAPKGEDHHGDHRRLEPEETPMNRRSNTVTTRLILYLCIAELSSLQSMRDTAIIGYLAGGLTGG